MISFNKCLEEYRAEQIAENAANVLSDRRKLMEKIENRYNDTVRYMTECPFERYAEDTISRLEEGDINTTLLYMTNITRQNAYEHIQIRILEQYFKCEFTRYNRFGFMDSKTFDGVNEERKIILNCKYIKESGGAQSNQFSDLMLFNKYVDGYMNCLVVSGNYGIKKIREFVKSGCERYAHVIILDDGIEIIGPLF